MAFNAKEIRTMLDDGQSLEEIANHYERGIIQLKRFMRSKDSLWAVYYKTVDATDREVDILSFIARFIEDNGYPPTRAEIAKGFDFSSKNGVTDFVNSLARKDYIDLVANVSRGLRVTEKGKKALEAMYD